MTLSLDQWIEERRNHLGASECAAVLGQDPNYGPLHIYERKVTGYTLEDNKALKFGRMMEDPIAQMYKDDTGRPVWNPGATKFQYHPKYPWIAATLDRETQGTTELPAPNGCTGKGALEIKNIDIPGLNTEDWNADNPDIMKFVIQNQVQMACASMDWGSVTGKFPYYQLAWFDQERNDAFFEAAISILGEFWDRVQHRDPPPPDDLSGTLDVVKRLYPKENGETVMLEPDIIPLVDEWEKLKATENTAKKEAKVIEAKLRAVLGEATFGNLGDGTMLSNKTTKRNGYTVKPTEFRTLRRTRIK